MNGGDRVEYLKRVLGIEVLYENKALEHLPNFISTRYDSQKVSLNGQKTVFLYPKTELEQVETLKKHLERVKKVADCPVILVLEQITARQKEYLEAFSLKNINPTIVIITGSIPITVVALEAEVKLSPINCNIEVRGYVKIPKRINKKKSFLLKFPFSLCIKETVIGSKIILASTYLIATTKDGSNIS